jgi:hypothetical protein
MDCAQRSAHLASDGELTAASVTGLSCTESENIFESQSRQVLSSTVLSLSRGVKNDPD